MTNARRAAMELARKGLAVARIRRGTKDHFVDRDWKQTATADPLDVYDNWTSSVGDALTYNSLCQLAGYVVVDVDVPGDSHGADAIDGNYSLAEAGIALAPTYQQATPSGGVHWFYLCPAGESYSPRKLVPGVDIKAGAGAFVLGAGSWTDYKPGKSAAGEYKALNDLPIAELPASLAEYLSSSNGDAAAPGSVLGDLDTDAQIAEARRYATSVAPQATRGCRGYTAVLVAHHLGDLGVSEETAHTLIEDWNAARCSPPFDGDECAELHRSVTSAYAGRKTPLNRLGLIGAFDPVEIAGVDLDNTLPQPIRSRIAWFDIHSPVEAASIPPIPWLAYNRLIKRAVSTLVAPPGVGKSIYSMQMAVALATGRGKELDIDLARDYEPGPVVIFNAEETLDIMRGRLAAICEYSPFNVSYSDIADKIALWSGVDHGPICIARKPKGRFSDIEATAQYEELIECVADLKAKAVIIDPAVEMHLANENDNAEMAYVMGLTRAITFRADTSALLIHHSRKPGNSDATGYAGDQFSGRGASAMAGSVRLAYTLYNMSPKEIETYGVDPRERHLYARIDDAKSNYSLMSPDAKWYKRTSVLAPNGEHYGVLAPVELIPHAAQDAEAIGGMLGEAMTPGQRITLADAAKLLASNPLFSGSSVASLRGRIAGALKDGPVKVGRQLLIYEKHSERSGEVRLEIPA